VLAPDGDLYVADNGNNTIRRVTTAGVVTTYAGSTAGFADGAPLTAQFNQPFGLGAAANGDLIVADRANYRIRRIVRSGNTAGAVETLAGSGATTSPGADGIGTAAEIPFPSAVYVRGNSAFVRDNSVLIRQIDLTTRAVTTFSGSRVLGEGFADGPPAVARFRNGGLGLTGGPAGGLLVGDDRGLRSVDAAGNVTTIASGNSFGDRCRHRGARPVALHRGCRRRRHLRSGRQLRQRLARRSPRRRDRQRLARRRPDRQLPRRR
jgi:hypothetical protein